MHPLQEKSIQCPYCWEQIEILIDCSVDNQEYIEDCQVCCRPIVFNVQVVANGEANIQVERDGA